MSDQSDQRPIDAKLVQRAQSGDVAAFDELVVKYSRKLYGLIYNMTSHKEDTNDLLQETFSRAYRSLRRFKFKSSFYTWIYMIATNTTLNHLKKRKRRPTMSLDDVDNGLQNDELFTDLSFRSNPRHSHSVKELQIRLNEALQKLSTDHRVVVTLFDIQGLPHAQIAKVLSISEGTVRSRLHYAHQILQSQLDDLRD